MSKTTRAIGIHVAGRKLRLALVRRDGKELLVESVETVSLRDPLSDLTTSTGTLGEGISADPFDIGSLLDTEETSPVEQSNLETLLDILERYGEDVGIYAFSGDPAQAKFVAFQQPQPPRKKREWLDWGTDQGLALSGEETPRLFPGEGESDWILFHLKSSPLLKLFREARNHLGRYAPRIQLVEDPRISLAEGVALSGIAPPHEKVTLLHHDSTGGWFLELSGQSFCTLVSLPREEWEEVVKTRLSSEVAQREASLFMFSGSLTKESLERLLKERIPKAQIEPLAVLPWDNAAGDVPESLSLYAVPIALAAKALSHGDARFYSAPPRTYFARRSGAFLEPSIAGIAIVAIALLGSGSFTIRHIQQSKEIHKLQAQVSRLEAVTKSQAEVQNLFAALEQQHGATTHGGAVLDSLVAATVPLSPVLDTLCTRGRRVGDFWLTDFDWSPDEITIAGIALRRERVDEVARILPEARLMTVTTQNLGGRTVYSFVLSVPNSKAAKQS